MSKHTAPVPSLKDALVWLDFPRHRNVLLRPTYVPDFAQQRVYVAVELVVVSRLGAMVVCRRFGESVSMGSPTAHASALFRACMQAHLWCEGKAPNELYRLLTWEADMLR